MAVEVYWLVPERVMYMRVTGVFTVPEIIETHRRNMAMMDTITHDQPIHFIDDNREMTKGPDSLAEVREANRPFTQHPKLGWWVLVDTSMMVRFISSVVGQVTRTRLKSVATWDDVVAFFPRVDTTVPPLPSAPPREGALFRVEIPAEAK